MLISLHNITIKYGDRTSFANTSLEVNSGETWAVYGPTGSGKSTLAKAICRQFPLSTGEIRYYFDDRSQGCVRSQGGGRSYLLPGEILIFSAETHQQFWRSFTEYHQARWQSFEGEDAPLVDTLLDPARIFARSPYEISQPVNGNQFLQQKNELVHLFGIESLLHKKAHLLSHGESRKIFLVQLLLRSPKLLILDDPFSGLDENTRQVFRTNLNHLLAAQDVPVLLITPRLDEIPATVTHLLLVDNHRVIGKGPRDQITQQAQLPHQDKPALVGQIQHESFTEMARMYAARLAEKSFVAGSELVNMQDACVSYQGYEVLSHVNWVVRQGERWGLRGPNGAGKTTLLSLILGDNPQAYSNTISLFGKERGAGESIWEIKQKIGWVSPELHIFYDRAASCLDVVNSGFFQSIGLYQQCTSEQAELSHQWLAAFDLAALADRPFWSLSTGQQRLVLLARALVKEPPLLILDEPCQGLDDLHRHTFITLIDELCTHSALTLIYVTHYRDEFPASITHHLALEHGKIRQVG